MFWVSVSYMSLFVEAGFSLRHQLCSLLYGLSVLEESCQLLELWPLQEDIISAEPAFCLLAESQRRGETTPEYNERLC